MPQPLILKTPYTTPPPPPNPGTPHPQIDPPLPPRSLNLPGDQELIVDDKIQGAVARVDQAQADMLPLGQGHAQRGHQVPLAKGLYPQLPC